MKILFSGNTAWSMYNFRRLVFEHFLKQGHEVVVVSPFDETYQQQLKALGCKVLPIDIEAKGNNPLKEVAGQEGLEPPTFGFGDQRSTN